MIYLLFFSFSGGHELEWGKKDSFEGEGSQHKERNGHPVCFYCFQNCKFLECMI